MPKQQNSKDCNSKPSKLPLSFFACPNGDCADFSRFDVGNLSVAEWMGKDKAIRRLYCRTCGTRFSERQGSLMQCTKLLEADVVRIIKCLGHGCSIEATADPDGIGTRTVQRLLEKAGKQAEDFHRLQLERLNEPLEAIQLDELHGRVAKNPKETKIILCPSGCANVGLKKRAYGGSCGVGCNQPVPDQSAGGPTHPGNGVPIGGLGGDVFDNNKFASVVDRRSSAVSSGDSEGFWPSQASSPSKGTREKTSSETQTTAEFADRCSQKASRPARQSVASIDQSLVWFEEGHRTSHSEAGHRPKDKYLSSGTIQWNDKRSASPSGSAQSQRFSSDRDAAIFLVAVAGSVQLDESTLLSARPYTSDGVGFDQRGLVGSQVCSLSGPYQRPITSGVGRAAQQRLRIGFRSMST